MKLGKIDVHSHLTEYLSVVPYTPNHVEIEMIENPNIVQPIIFMNKKGLLQVEISK